jgi:hypothetical protein
MRIIVTGLLMIGGILRLCASEETILRKSLKGYTDYKWKTERSDSIFWGAELSAVASSGKYAPFWFSNNRDGVISTSPYSGNIALYFGKEQTQKRRWIDYDFGIEFQGQVSTYNPELIVRQLYAAARFLVLDIRAGVKPTLFGYYSSNERLSSGGFLFSRDARPMPHIFIGIEDYVPFPFLFGYLEVKGGLTHGWFTDNIYIKNGYLHHKFAGLRIGGDLPVNLSYEFHHAAQWGGISPVYGDLGSDLKSFYNVFLSKSGGKMANDQINAEGNHIGSQVLTFEAKWKGWRLNAYWEMVFEDGPVAPIWKTMNLPDGLWGVSLSQNSFPFIKSVLYEYFSTTQQSGLFHDRDGIIYGGADNYFANGIYRNGWNYFYRTMGNPFITSPVYNDNMQENISTKNNRVRMHHVGIGGDIYGYEYRVLASFVKNYGTYATPNISDNASILLEVKKHVSKAWGLDFGLSFGLDYGSQFGNSFGTMFSVTKRGLIKTY